MAVHLHAAPHLAAGSLVALSLLPLQVGCGSASLKADFPMPPLQAAGWLGGPPPPAAELRGNVVVIYCWASW